MLYAASTGIFKLVKESAKLFKYIAERIIIWDINAPAREAANRFEPIRNMLILLPLPLILFGVLLAFFIRSYRKPEKVLKSTTVEQLQARGKNPRGYLRFWRIEMMLTMIFTFVFSVFVVLSVYATNGSDILKLVSFYFMNVLIAYGLIISIAAYIGRGLYFGKWGIRFIAITQGGPPNPRSGSSYTM